MRSGRYHSGAPPARTTLMSYASRTKKPVAIVIKAVLESRNPAAAHAIKDGTTLAAKLVPGACLNASPQCTPPINDRMTAA